MGGAVFPPCNLAWGQTVVGVMAMTSFKRACARAVVFSASDPMAGTVIHPSLRWRLLDTHRPVWLSLLWGHCSFLLGPCAHKVLFAPFCLPRVCFPVLWNFCNQIPLAFKVKFPGVSQSLCWIPQAGKSVVGPRTFTIVWKLLWYNCSPVCGLSARWLSGEAHMLCLPGLLQPEPLSPQQAIADPCCCKRHSNTQRQVWLSLMWGSQVLVHTWFCLTPLSISGWSEVWF